MGEISTHLLTGNYLVRNDVCVEYRTPNGYFGKDIKENPNSRKMFGRITQESHRMMAQPLVVKHIGFANARRFEMKTKKIITAALLSAGLILGSTSAAFADDPTPTTTVTLA